MKSKKVICIVSLMYLLIHFPLSLIAQDLFVAKEDLIVFKEANIKSDTSCTIKINDKVEVVEVKKVWLKKWAKIQSSKGILGYVLFNKLEPIDSNTDIQKKDNNNEDLTQNTDAIESDSKAQNEEKIVSNKEPTNNSNESNTEKISTSENKQNNNVSQTNEHSKNNSFPTWVWFVIIATVALSYLIYRYKKYMTQKFAYSIFAVTVMVSLLLSFSSILFLHYLIGQSVTGEMWGIPSKTFNFLLIGALILTIGILYYYNYRKTNWYLAILNAAIQILAVGIFVIVALGRMILKILSNSKYSNSNYPTSQSDSSQTSQGSTITSTENMYANSYSSGQRKWEWDGTYLKLYSSGQKEWEYDGCYLKKYSNGQREWEYDGCYLKRYSNGQREWEYDGRYLKKYSSGQKEWEYDGIYLIKYSNGQRIMECKNFPIPVIAKAIGII